MVLYSWSFSSSVTHLQIYMSQSWPSHVVFFFLLLPQAMPFLCRVSFLFIAKAFRVLSLVTLSSHWGLMAHTLINLLPATAPILMLQFLICSSFSLLGVHLFGGKVYIGHPLLENTEYANGRLFAFNYNDYASALVTSFNLCVVNNWYVIMDAYAFVTETPWSRSFFIVFWAVAVAFSLPIVVAFFVEAFVKQMEKVVLLQVPQGASVFPSKSTYTRKLSYHDLYKDIVKNPTGPMSTMSIWAHNWKPIYYIGATPRFNDLFQYIYIHTFLAHTL